MAFRFSLRGLLRLRASQERAERLRLMSLAAEILQTQLAAASLVQENLQAKRRMQRQMVSGVFGAELDWERACEESRNARRNAMLRVLAELTQRYRRQSAIYQKVLRELRILENLRGRRLAQYRMEQSRLEQRSLDDSFLLHSFQPPEG
jgi:flagellar biosynthesis chaperone FliJ